MRMPRIRHMRELPGWAFVLLITVGVSMAAAVPWVLASKDARRPEVTPVPAALALPPGTSLADLKEGKVEDVVDGDTIDVSIDGKVVRIRYYGVDTPERGERCYREATDRNKTLVADRVLLLPDARDQDRYSRTLRYVFRPDGTSVDATLVAEGFGHAWREDGRYKQDIISLEDQARAADRGCLWK